MISNDFGHMTFWNPLTGSNFSEEDDDICPLINIDCLVSTNVRIVLCFHFLAHSKPNIFDSILYRTFTEMYKLRGDPVY